MAETLRRGDVHLVGVGADGWEGLAEPLRALVAQAEVVVGGERHLAMLPPHVTAERVVWPSPMRAALPGLVASWSDRRVVVLASGDPFVAGIGTTLRDFVPPERLVVHPAVSSESLARARMGWPAESVTVLRDHAQLPRHLAAGQRLLVLSRDEHVPAEVVSLLVDAGLGASRVTALAHLGGADESVASSTAQTWKHAVPSLHVLAVEVVADRPTSFLGWVAGLPDDAFEHDGQLTKRDLRASALARLAPVPGAVLWDVGAGAGSVGIEWMRAHPTCRTVAVESHPERAARIARNAARLGVPGLQVVEGRAPDALADLPDPDAVFVGGGATGEGVLDTAWARLGPGGRLVVHAVTLETERVVVDWASRVGGELTRLAVETARPIGTFTGWEPARAVVQWAVTKEETP
ncbi:precorrin-6y C5,15-methyltransferase (decarboxylating) subunit CbiE [Aeromicrobium sp.]|uniref:precorrin-6y C5,15-methyltransferase (decarboxylating) subunit CbiE n=1 Tax=Aeromicrobium sp. TaxID=1871063 RepID=UPI0025BF433C|nr:precorrin-6y C5,15-methyltransferase (decarboxylating) subunit CbiE [Aeromicrobium sp.]MCK5890452.1 precorrin-6y C5,15-methyltransferase (decarboxylating) subunit CbiE [Aeromicrobium sp.]